MLLQAIISLEELAVNRESDKSFGAIRSPLARLALSLVSDNEILSSRLQISSADVTSSLGKSLNFWFCLDIWLQLSIFHSVFGFIRLTIRVWRVTHDSDTIFVVIISD